MVQLNDRNIITGGYDGSFLPNNPITRRQAALILVRELGISLDNRPDPGCRCGTNYAKLCGNSCSCSKRRPILWEKWKPFC
ncbi:S-layer homology domain-containing protein [Anaerobacillus sp. HL2]|nr:S-layer homology domain-containing protein [Anaerobacillus sp. HL2]